MLEPGEVLQSRYIIEDVIGAGGMGRVYRARQMFLARRLVAIKEIHLQGVPEEERPGAVISFLREAETLALLQHPNLIRVHDCFEEDGQLFLVMEYIDGWTLEKVLDQYPRGVPVEYALNWLRQLCTVLNYLHNHTPQIIFRDLKPSNIMLDSSDLIRLIDFGIVEVAFAGHRYEDRTLQGTFGYASPEQLIDAEHRADPRLDIYGLGATMYHLLTGECPMDAVARMVDVELTPAASVNPQVPQWLSDAVDKMMALRGEDRFASALQVRDRIEQHEHQRARPSNVSVEAWWKEPRGRVHNVELIASVGDYITFSAFGTLGDKVPRELYFKVPEQSDALRVRIRMLESVPHGDHLACDAQLLDTPVHLLKRLHEALRPELCNSRKAKRRWERVEVSVDVLVLETGGLAQAVDLSIGGLRMLTPHPLRLGARLTLGLLLNDVIFPDLELSAEVRWCRASWHGGYECGLCWTALDAQSRDVLSLFLEGTVLRRAIPV